MSDDVRFLLYFLPGLKAGPSVKDQIVKVVGPGAEGELRVANVASGPGQQGPGVLVACLGAGVETKPGEVEKRLQYCPDPARQVWIEATGYWVGYDAGRCPRAEDLCRPVQVGGWRHNAEELGHWVVPLARHEDGRTEFDERIVFLPDGGIVMKPLARYERLCGFAHAHFERLVQFETSEAVEMPETLFMATVAAEAISVNYFAGRYELGLMGVLTKRGTELICGYLCDWPTLREIMKDREKDAKKNDEARGASGTPSGVTAA